MLRHLLFDFDGTLIDSSEGILASFEMALQRRGMPAVVSIDKSLIGPPLLDTLRKISGVEDARKIDCLAQAFKDAYDTEGYRKTVAYPGIAPALKELRGKGVTLYIVTNKRMVPTSLILAHLGWNALFEGIFTLDSAAMPTSSKVDLVAKILLSTGIRPEQALMVGDTPEDGRAAFNNGLGFAVALWGYGRFDDVTLSNARRLRVPAEIALLA